MRRTSVIPVVIFIAIFPLALPAASSVGSPSPELCATNHLGTSQSNSQIVVEVLDGSQARAYLAWVKKAHPNRFEGVGEGLREIGAHPTNIVTVARTKRIQFAGSQQEANPGSGEQANIPNLPPFGDLAIRSDSASSAEGEIIFTAWDDGYDGTWEGTIYHEDYSDGSWSIWEGQANIETADYHGMWGNLVSWGGGPGGDPIPKSLTGSEAVVGKDITFIAAGSGWGDFFWCVAARMAACHSSCVWMGPFWGKCMIGCGAVVAILCAIEEL